MLKLGVTKFVNDFLGLGFLRIILLIKLNDTI